MTSNALPWHERPQVRKGDLGEQVVDEFLRAKFVIPYRPVYDGAHPFDRLCATADKRTIFVADIKTKARREFYADTGFNIEHYGDYKHIENRYGLRVFIFFVDEKLAQVYGNWLSKMEQPTAIERNGKQLQYPLKQGKIIYFPLVNMEPISDLDLDKARELMRLSTRTYEYGGIEQRPLPI